MAKYISITEARKQLRCSAHLLHHRLKDGTIRGAYEALPGTTRKVWRLEKASFRKYAKAAKSNRRIGRELRRAPKRKPYRNKGYVYVYWPENPNANCDGYVAEHVLVMEQIVGRHLEGKEEVHHRNGIRHDNRPENLVLYSSRSDHLKNAHGLLWKLRLKLERAMHHKERLTNAEKIALVDELLGDSSAENPVEQSLRKAKKLRKSREPRHQGENDCDKCCPANNEVE